jgi:predicted ATPase
VGRDRGPVEGVQLAALRYEASDDLEGFPFSVPALKDLADIGFDVPVTLLVGENGTGKSTLLEALALAADLPAVGSARLASDPTLEAQRRLARLFRLSWRRRSHRGFFLRAEDFFGFQRQLARARADHETEMARIDREMAGASGYARGLAQGPHRASLSDMARRYGDDPDAASHGEAFLRLFGSRLVPDGLFLLDEPEAALSPQSQLGFLAMVKEAVASGSQFVIATHSPILMAIPSAAILTFDDPPVRRVAYEDLEPVRLMRDFLQAPQRFLRLIWPEG